jgi:16S rRNA (cytidine1402-2'-O)-methyltransferase
MAGLLTLIPTPIQEDLPLETRALEILQREALLDDVILLVEEHKVARQRWLRWGLPRESIERFILLNEHTQSTLAPDIIKQIKSGKRAYLISDCGLPAFCDPGQELVNQCHKNKIKVTSTPFPNSIALSIALSGFPHDKFIFSGFVPVKEPLRSEWIKKELLSKDTMVWMETPYRLIKLLEDLKNCQRELFLACDLGAQNEELFRGSSHSLIKELGTNTKREFVLIIGPR